MRFRVLLSSGLVISTILLACGGATAPAIGDGDGASSGNGSGTGSGNGSGGDNGGGGGGGGGGGTPDAGVDPVDSGAPDDPGTGDSDPGFIGCGTTKCKSSGGILGSATSSYCCVERTSGGSVSTCKNAAVSSCNGHRFLCDEAADCTNGNVCCVEVQTSGGSARALSSCRSSCATGATRFQVCKTDDECEGGGTCKAYDCGNLFPGLRFCQKPDRCK